MEEGRLNKSISNFDAYVQLQSESYEFITRTVAMHNWLKEAYRLLNEQPGLSADSMFEAWSPAFERIYGHLFAAFLRPYRVMIFPLGEFLKSQAAFLPGTFANKNLNTFEAGFDHVNSAIDGHQELSPLRLIGDTADQDSKLYLQMLEQTLGYFNESQFPLPKDLVLQLKQIASSYPKASRLAQRHEAMFRSTWEKSLKRFTLEIKKTARLIPEFKEFYNIYTSIFTEEYDQLLGSTEFIEVQNNYMAMNLDVMGFMKKAMEAQMRMFPALPFVTGSEMEALEKNVHGYKRRIDGLERRIRKMERAAVAVPAKVEVEMLTRNVQRQAVN
jgi:hypothetical protein